MKRKIAIICVAVMLCAGAVYAAVKDGGERSTEPIREETTVPVEEITVPEDHQAYLEKLVEQGYDPQRLESIYQFWLTCGEDISLIEQMYRAGEEANFEGIYWVEDSYNTATHDAHGVLGGFEVREYLNKSITKEQIAQANIMSRQGVYTIREILDRLLEGEAWSKLVNDVYGSGTVPEKVAYVDVETLSVLKKKSGLTPIRSVVSEYYTFEEPTVSNHMYGTAIGAVYGSGELVSIPTKELGEVSLFPETREER